MPAEILQVTQYEYYQFAGRGEPLDTKAVVICLLKDSPATLYMYFVGGEQPLSVTAKSGNNFYLYYRYADLSVIIDMLRNEKPIYLIYVPEGDNNTRLSTSFEAVGEGEQGV